MKWPERLTLVRHGESAYNQLKVSKITNPQYVEFRNAYESRQTDPKRARELAQQILDTEDLTLKAGDHDTELTELGQWQARTTAQALSTHMNEEPPDVVFVSPYTRTHHTLDSMIEGWPAIGEATIIEEERIREQEHGLALLYNDWRIFDIMHPEQEALKAIEGPYWYRFPQGENIPDVRERGRSWTGTLTRDYKEKKVFAITHHLAILSVRANFERLNAKQFMHINENDKPINLGVTDYKGNPDKGKDGKLELVVYNAKLY